MDWLAYQQLNTLGPTIFYVFSFSFSFFDWYILRVLHSCPPIRKELSCHAQNPTTYSYPPNMGRNALRSRGLNSKSFLQGKIQHLRDLSQLYTTI